MSLLFWLAVALVAGAFVLIEVLDVLLGVGADRVTHFLARKGKKEEPRRPWSERTGT